MSFDQIPATLRTPGVFAEVDPTVAQSNIGVFPFRALIIGQRTAAGTVAAEIVKRTTSPNQAREEHGPGSLSHLLAEAFLQQNPLTELDVISLDDDGAAVASEARVAFGGTIANPGTLILYVAGVRLQVLCQTDLDTCATSLVAAINVETSLPCTAAVGVPTTDVVLTAKNGGVTANQIDVRVNHLAGEELPVGLTVTVTAFGTETLGAGDPDVADVLPDIAGTKYDGIVHPWPTNTANLNVLETELTARADALAGIQGWAMSGHAAAHATLAALGDARNDEFHSLVGMESFPGWDVIRGANIAGQALRFLEVDPVRPLTGRQKLQGFGPSAADRFTDSERNLLLHDGIATVRYDRSNQAEIERLITTYQETTGGSPDESFLDVQIIFGLNFVRQSFVAFFQRQYPNHKLAANGTPIGPGQPTITPQIAKGEAVGWYAGLVREGICQDLQTFKDQSVFDLGVPAGRLEAFLAVTFVDQFRVLAAKVQFRRSSAAA